MLLGNVNKKITTDKVRTGVENARNLRHADRRALHDRHAG